ncbi:MULTISPECIES: DUF6541 family protein [unclassified Dietzia]|uniref:DUF6541 family protein n=2 Tax=Dietzia TaxID=37914 RepID=UPI000D20748D|nr:MULTISPECIES: DUF6541 family protein [unclassified Dietzia]AVZ38542.1 hypothetical protein CT688_02635 [Dietzia sp. JS16-p6b]QGW23604.1 hypothetical protein GJR88_00848 [Dietzia sp. DQ12-45-1b]
MVMLTLTSLLVVPGLIVGLAARLPLRLAVGTSIPVSAGIVTIATYVYGRSGVPWSLAGYAVATAVTAAIVGLVGLLISGSLWLRRRRRTRAGGRSGDPGGTSSPIPAPSPRRAWWWLLPAASILVSAWLIGQMIITELSATPGGTANIFQGWDAHWHANYLRFIHDTGLASPDQAGELRYPENGATLYYPSTWHAIAALVMGLRGIGAVETYNLVQIGSMALVFPLGVAALAWLITHRRFSRPAVATSAAVAAMATPLFPGLPFVEVMVAATPSGVANGLAGLVAAVVVASLSDRRLVPAAALGLVGVGGIHPSAMVTAAVIVLFWWLFEGLWRPVRGRLRDFLVLAGVGLAGVLTLLPQVLTVSEDADEISAFQFEIDADRAAVWGRAVALQVRHVQDWGVRWVLLALAVLGVLVLVRRLVLWPILLWAGVLVVCVNSMSMFGNWTGGVLRGIGSIYYNDPRRIGVLLAVLVAAAVGVGVGVVVQALAGWAARLIDPITDSRGTGAAGLRVAVALAALVATGSWVVQASPEYASAAGANQRAGRMVDGHDLRAFEWLSRQPQAYSGLVYTNPDEGSGWMYATHGLPSTARHYLQPGSTAPLTTALFFSMDRAGTDPRVDSALDELGVTYVYVSPPNYWGFQKPNEHLLRLDQTPGLVKVYSDSQVRIFAVRAAFTQEEIDRILADSPFPPDRRTPLTRATELYGGE